MRRLGKAAKGLLMALLAAAVLLNLWQLAARVLLKQELPGVWGYSYLIVLSGSMEPAISAGDLIVIHRETDYAVGDVITFAQDGAFTTHRVVGVQDGRLQTRGDANNVCDRQPVLPQQVMGRVALVIPAVGGGLLFLRTPGGMGCVLLLGLLGLGLARLSRKRYRGKRCAK